MSPNLAFLFDLDGVVVDSMPLHTEAWRVYLDRLGISATKHDIETSMHGRRNDEIVAYFIAPDLTPEVLFEHGAAKERLFRDLMRHQLQRHLVPGITEFLDRHSDLPIGLASNAEPANIDFVLDGLGLRSRFPVIVNGQQVERPKPFPDVYLRAAELLGVPPGDCVVFEDSPAGIQAGRASGARVIGVQTHSADLLGVDFAIRDFRDPGLEPWLEGLALTANENLDEKR